MAALAPQEEDQTGKEVRAAQLRAALIAIATSFCLERRIGTHRPDHIRACQITAHECCIHGRWAYGQRVRRVSPLVTVTSETAVMSNAKRLSTTAAPPEPDQLVPDPVVCKEIGVTSMTLWRYDHDPELNFPAAIKIRSRNFRSRRLLEAWKTRMLRRAIEQRDQQRRAVGGTE